MRQSRVKRYARRLDDDRLFEPKRHRGGNRETALIFLDEFEAMRLVDFENNSQVDASQSMQVSRATLQRLLESGRKKLIGAILYNQDIELKNDIQNIKLKGENQMDLETKNFKKIAFPTNDKLHVDAHFGHALLFVVYTIENNTVINKELVTPPPHTPGSIPQFLANLNVDVIITGGMGQMAVDLFQQNNIDVILGAKGAIEENLEEYLGGFLNSTGTSCDHSEGGHHHE
jgi:predicted DNA-binding protein (UPF0251 family)/predicted Fe-Mo cluster-binding NifX family protein